MGQRQSFPSGSPLPVDKAVREISEEISERAPGGPYSEYGSATVHASDRHEARSGDRTAVDCRFQGSLDQNILFQTSGNDSGHRAFSSPVIMGRKNCEE